MSFIRHVDSASGGRASSRLKKLVGMGTVVTLSSRSIFSDFDAVKAHMQIQHKLGPKSKKVSNHQSTVFLIAAKNWLRKALSKKTKVNFDQTKEERHPILKGLMYS